MTTPSSPPDASRDEPAPRHLDEEAAWDEAAQAARAAHDMDTTAVRRRDLMGLSEPAEAERLPEGAGRAGAAPGTPGTPVPPAVPVGAPATPEDPRTAMLRARMRAAAERPATVLDGATEARPLTRTRAHVWGVVLTLLLTPVAWYLTADAGARLGLAPGAAWETGDLNAAALAELVGGLLVTAVVLLAARWSSVGAIVTGSLALAAGLVVVAAPLPTQDAVEPVLSRLSELGGLGANLAHHLLADAATARLVLYGAALVLVGVVSHGARRLGRAEERTRAAAAGRPTLAKTAPRHGSSRR